MWPFRKKQPRVIVPATESVGMQLKILRTHMAAQQGDLATMRLQYAGLADRLDGQSEQLSRIREDIGAIRYGTTS